MFATHQIAHNDLAITVGRSGLGWSRLCAGTACGFGALLDTTNGCSRSRASGTTTLVGSAASATALGLGDIVESLIELARHDDDDVCVKLVRVGQRRTEKDRPARKKLYVLFKLMQLVRSAEDIE